MDKEKYGDCVVEFNNQSVRDLAWSLGSPPLVSNLSGDTVWPDQQWFSRLYDECLPWLKKLDKNPETLNELLAAQKDRRLGKYYETLWFFWLSHNPHYEIIENNLQIIIDGQTLGEMDFILLDKQTGRTLHWEVAVKFYLGIGDTSEMQNWHGPNLRDRLDIKVNHLWQRQSVISKQPQVRHWLQERGIHIDESRVILKGRLYYPWPVNASWNDALNVVMPKQCSKNHLRSWWLNTEQFERLFSEKQRFMSLINIGWLESIPTQSVKKSYTKTEIIETVSNKKLRLPLQLALCNLCHIRDRLFLVGFDWP